MIFRWFGGFPNLRSLHSRIGDTAGRSYRSVLCLNITVGQTMIVAFLDIIILSALASHLNDNMMMVLLLCCPSMSEVLLNWQLLISLRLKERGFVPVSSELRKVKRLHVIFCVWEEA